MEVANPRGSIKTKPRNHDGASAGKPVKNLILLALPRQEFETIFPLMDLIPFSTGTILNETAQPIEAGYFINSGVASIITAMSDGKSVEVGLTGKEGFVGVPMVVDLLTSPTRAIIQIEATAYRIAAKDFKSILPACPQLVRTLLRYTQELLMQSVQVAACNRLHEVEERLARWLLMCQDRLGGDVIPLTQEFLAHMLGTRRASVTVAAGILQKAGLIAYKRGLVKIENRASLEEASCECYAAITDQLALWHREPR